MASQEGSGFSLKDHLFNRAKVKFLAERFQPIVPKFNASRFVRQATKPFPDLELKERITHIATTLEEFLDPDFRIAAKQITAALPPPLDPNKTDDDFGDFIFAPLGVYIVRNGMARKHLKLSLRTLQQVTQRFSMEDSIRHFINNHTDDTMSELQKWTSHPNYHVRRLVSEGTRPLLPWSGRLELDIERPLPLLDELHADSTRYVTRSVANHLNDIAKQKPELVLAALKRWRKLARQTPEELAWMNKHTLRTLVKQGDSKTLRFLGYRTNPQIRVLEFTLQSTSIRPGEKLDFSFSLEADRKEPLIIDYVIHFVKANGSLAPKVHKLKQATLGKGESVDIRKRHLLKNNATTYTLYPGTHRITLQINGRAFGERTFELR